MKSTIGGISVMRKLMSRDIPNGWIEVPRDDFEKWLSNDAPNYRRDNWSNITFYYIIQKTWHSGVGKGDEFACHTLGDYRCYVDKKYYVEG